MYLRHLHTQLSLTVYGYQDHAKLHTQTMYTDQAIVVPLVATVTAVLCDNVALESKFPVDIIDY